MDRYLVTFTVETDASAYTIRDHYQYNNHPRNANVTQVSVVELDPHTLDDFNPSLVRPSKNPGNRRETYRVAIPGCNRDGRETTVAVFDPFVDPVQLKQILTDNGYTF